MSQGQAAEKGWFGAMEEGPGLKPGLSWDGLPRAKARCYSGKPRFSAACKAPSVCRSGRAKAEALAYLEAGSGEGFGSEGMEGRM